MNKTVALSVSLLAFAGTPYVHATAASSDIPAPRDTAYPGTIVLQVDASDVQRRIFRVHETIPVAPGPLVLQYAKWLPGNHAPTGPIDQLAGPLVRADGKTLEWTRDAADVYSFHLNVPEDVTRIEVELQFASPEVREQGRITMTAEILGAQWEKLLLYPAGHYSSRIQIEPSITLPAGWQFATALDGARRTGDTVHFSATPLNTLADSPLFAGEHFKRVELDANPRGPVHLNIVADAADQLEISPEALAAHRKLVAEATTLFGSRHFDHYDFLLAISADFSSIGLEHHRSSEDGVDLGYFKDWTRSEPRHDLLAHEMTHSWNGKFRRPADLWTPTFNVPMGNSLLWVYEGLTQYWGNVLAARSGLWSQEFTRGMLAASAATLQEQRPGRAWRNLQDTTSQPVITPRRPLSWVSLQRTEDYYREGALLWLEVDARLREKSHERVSLDDFAKRFFGVDDGSYVTQTYTFEDLVKALDAEIPGVNDWAQFLRTRLDGHDSRSPLKGIEEAGWRVVFKSTPSTYTRKSGDINEAVDWSFSLGFVVNKDARLTQVVWDSPAFKAGLTLESTIVAVNGVAFRSNLLDEAILEARDPHKPVELIVRDRDRFRTVRLDYTGGPRYPDLARIDGARDRLSEILKPRT